MGTNEVISSLVNDLEPVSPLPLVRVRLARWLIAGSSAAWLVAVAIGLRADLVGAASTVPFHVHAWLLLFAATGAAGAALALGIPGEPTGWMRLRWPIGALGAWVAWLIAELVPVAASRALQWPNGIGAVCVAKALAIGVVPSIVLAAMLGRGAPADRRTTVMYAALAGAAMGAFGVELTCPMRDAMHLLVWHAVPAVTFVCAAGALGHAVSAGAVQRRGRE